MTDTIVQGNLVEVKATFTNSMTGIAVEPSVVLFSLRRPDGSIEKPSATNDGTGLWHANIIVGLPGRWRYRWAGTGVVTAATEGAFWVANSEII